ncbi:MAG: hypothetical protein P0Y65_13920 [Candidatus Devosia phytovorans]|uniref:Restriction endonuclease n=1 Tax=Candidatus Devosia phytovorans TaxID=3121372 RepID=A0AAJ5VSV7_9HYPH|nr:hypothetical protein [Devosia sp.]WEK03285.1 MAG: hypothetical protein P0Y65_13920 [Devosia sp.]
MTTFIERQIEYWLDNQGERRYQPAFVQMLVSAGWNILHNTRHAALEYGKDVIARSPEGGLYCFQLKGHPGGRLKKSEAAGHLVQLTELLEVPVFPPHKRSKGERHTAVFVTNGEVDEEAMVLFSTTATARIENPLCPADHFEVWARGKLISMFIGTAGRVWPTSPESTRQMLNHLAQDGRDTPKLLEFTNLLAAAIPPPDKSFSGPAKLASITSLFLMAEIMKAPWYATANHHALFSLTVVTAVYAIRFADIEKRRKLIRDYAEQVIDHAKDLVLEAKERDLAPDLTWVEHDALSEVDIMFQRRNMVADCAAILLLTDRIRDEDQRSYARSLVQESVLHPKIWGQGALPSLLVRFWATTSWAPPSVDRTLGDHIQLVLYASDEQMDGILPPAAPYFDFEDCWARNTGHPFFANDDVFDDNPRRHLWFMRAFVFALARRNWKQTCKALWPAFTRVVHEEPELPDDAFFDARYAQEGKMRTYTFQRYEWQSLLEAGRSLEAKAAFLAPFGDLDWLFAAYVSAVPYRAWPGVLIWLDRRLTPPAWY